MIITLEGKRALVTGGNSGIGAAIALALAEAGAKVAVNYVGHPEAADALVQTIKQKHGEAISLQADVSDPQAVGELFRQMDKAWGGIDILINNAGIQRRGPLEDYPEETWRELMGANLDSVFYVGQSVARAMIPRKRGIIINIGSVQCELARPNIAPYTASKGAVKMLTKGMATDWGKHGLRVNAIAPGYFKTELNKALVEDEKFSGWLAGRTPMGRWGDVDELVGAAVFLCSPSASFVHGHILYVDGGITASL